MFYVFRLSVLEATRNDCEADKPNKGEIMGRLKTSSRRFISSKPPSIDRREATNQHIKL